MGRSVSVARGAVHVEYAVMDMSENSCVHCGHHFDGDICPECGSTEVYHHDLQFEFDSSLDYFREKIIEAFPSTYSVDKWLDREDHAVAANHFAYFGVSEYCGVVSMWVAPRDDDYQATEGIRDRWINSIGKRFEQIARGTFDTPVIRIGAFSNGESVYQLVA